MIPPRIASLVPSVTELVVALGLGPCLVARTGFCIHPREALSGVPKVGGTKDVDLVRLRELAPTHVILNIDENRAETAAAISAWGPAAPELVITHPKAPEDNLALVDQLAAAFVARPGVAARAAALKRALAAELAHTRPDGRPARRVLYLIWRDPWMSVARDTYLSRMLARVHWQTLPDQAGGDRGAARYPRLTGHEAWLAEVDLVLLSSEPYRFTEVHVAEVQRLAPQARVQLVDGELLSWYGPRAVPGLAYLRGLAEACG
jgi:ABC-type Fe3+-hydroxamate transport system substrate-binding protein